MKAKSILFTAFMTLSYTMSAQPALTIDNLPDLKFARAGHIQIVSGTNEYVIVGGHINGFLLTRNVEVYNKSTNEWQAKTSADNRDMGFVAKLNNGKYLIGAGCSSGYGVGQLATTEIFNPVDMSFTSAGSMKVARTNASSATLKDGRVLVVGNWYNTAGAAEIYDPVSNLFSTTGACLVQRSYPVIIPTDDGGAIVGGGYGNYGGVTSGPVFEKYNSQTNSFSEHSSTLFNGESGLLIYSGQPTITKQYLLPNGNYALLVLNSDYTKLRVISIDPKTEAIAEIATEKEIPTKDIDNPTISYGNNSTPLIDVSRNLMHIVQSGKGDTHILRIITINLLTGSVNWSKVSGFDYYPSSANICLLDDGRILFSGGNKPDNFTLSSKSFIVSVPAYAETDLDEAKMNKNVSVFWSSELNSFVLNQKVANATLYGINGKCYSQSISTNQLVTNELPVGVYILKVKMLNSDRTQFIKAVKR